MNICQLLKKYETVYISFEEGEKERLIARLRSLGFEVPDNISSPVKVHRDRTVTFITGFNEGMLYSMEKYYKKMYPEYFRIDYKKLSDENIESKWYSCR